MAVTVNQSWPYLLGIYEHALMSYWREHVSVGMTVLDVGGHSGYHTIYLANLVGPTGRVVALEPVSELAQQLAINVGLNDLDNCQVLETAASDEEAMIELFIPHGDLYSTIATTDPTRAEEADGVVRTVQARRLDSIATTIGQQVHWVKIDVEGAEAVALSGATALLADPNTIFVVEVNEWITAESQSVIEMLRRSGRQLDVIGTRGLTAFIAATKKAA
jgi:FkbM family methyltransferase